MMVWQTGGTQESRLSATGCSSAACLRAVFFKSLNDGAKSTETEGASYSTLIDDDDFIVAPAARQLGQGNFVHVSYIIGIGSDEDAVSGPAGLTTTEPMFEVVEQQCHFDEALAQDLAILNLDIPDMVVSESYPGRPNVTYGAQMKRSNAIFEHLGQHGSERCTAIPWVGEGWCEGVMASV